jgi:hypothetical protein
MAKRKTTPTHLNVTLPLAQSAYVRRHCSDWQRSMSNFAAWLIGLGIKSIEPTHPAAKVPVAKRGRPWPKKAGGK